MGLMKELLSGVNQDGVLQYVLATLDQLLTGACSPLMFPSVLLPPTFSPLPPSLFSYFVPLTQSYSRISLSSLPPLHIHPPPTLPFPATKVLSLRALSCFYLFASPPLSPLPVLQSLLCHSFSTVPSSLTLFSVLIIGVLGAADGRVASHFQAVLVESKGCVDPYGPLMKLLTRSSLFVLEKSSALLAKLLTFPLPPAVDSQAEQETPATTAAAAHPH